MLGPLENVGTQGIALDTSTTDILIPLCRVAQTQVELSVVLLDHLCQGVQKKIRVYWMFYGRYPLYVFRGAVAYRETLVWEIWFMCHREV